MQPPGQSEARRPGYAGPVSRDREWWLRVVAVLTRPRLVFLALRADDEDDLAARQEPILLLSILAGVAALVLTPPWRELYDGALFSTGKGLDGLDVALLTFVTGALDGVVGYFVIGGALYFATRALGSLGSWLIARHVLAFAAVPLALSAPILLPVGLGAYGSDLYRRGGADSGLGGDVFVAAQLAFLAWSLGLLVLGVRTTYGWTWLRALGAVGLLAVFLVLFFVVVIVL
jgi:hypothetical protein